MTSKNILIVGVGNIGKRHLEALLNSKHSLNIHLVDPVLSTNNKLLINQSNFDYKKKKIFFYKTLNTVPAKIFLTILSTTANYRIKIIKHLIKNNNVKYWIIEKPLCQSLKDLRYIEETFCKRNSWVNLSYDSNNFLLSLKKTIKKNKLGNLLVTGKNWGLACNSIHYLQLFTNYFQSPKLTHTKIQLKHWYKTRRKGIYDVHGKIELHFNNNYSCTFIDNYEENSKEKIKKNCMIFYSKNKKLIINEGEKTTSFGKTKKQKISLPRVSRDIIIVLDSLIKKSTCALPLVSSCTTNQRLLLNIFIDSWNHIKKNKNKNVPIS